MNQSDNKTEFEITVIGGSSTLITLTIPLLIAFNIIVCFLQIV